MKRIVIPAVLTLAAAALVLVAFPQIARSARVSADAVDQIVLRADVFNGDGGAATTGIVNTRYCNTASVYADNSNGTKDRKLLTDWYAQDGTTLLFETSQWVVAGARTDTLIDPHASSATAASGETVLPMYTGEKMKFTMPADGGTNETSNIQVYCR